MIKKTENPLNLSLDLINKILPELQQQFDNFEQDPFAMKFDLTLEESGVSIEIKTKAGDEYSYSLGQLKKLKAELENPLVQSLQEVS
ncbi:hypothetical protein [Acinetobacter sp. YH16057]|uniref:hypothetical protein n=1 Tax=Acinetobacter sp. YH16057 TaxID=2601195 RepID=UPI0015D22359|nr:hypothetical protein [Acinetobacter sp. YH16057]